MGLDHQILNYGRAHPPHLSALVTQCLISHIMPPNRNGNLQFTATRQTKWKQTRDIVSVNTQEFARCVTPLCLVSSGDFNPMWKEVDVVGVVLRVGLVDRGSQVVHLVDHHVNIIVLKFWWGLKVSTIMRRVGQQKQIR